MGEFVDLCNRCVVHVPIDTVDKEALLATEYEDSTEDPVKEEDV